MAPNSVAKSPDQESHRSGYAIGCVQVSLMEEPESDVLTGGGVPRPVGMPNPGRKPAQIPAHSPHARTSPTLPALLPCVLW